jgi:hypothetical protein
LEFREAFEQLTESGCLPGPQKSHPNQTLAYRRHIGLLMVCPMDLDQVGPWFEPEMAAHTEPAVSRWTSVKIRPFANSRGATIGADQPPSTNRPIIGLETTTTHPADLHAPTQVGTHRLGSSPEGAVKFGAADAKARRAWESPFGRHLVTDVSDPAKRT